MRACSKEQKCTLGKVAMNNVESSLEVVKENGAHGGVYKRVEGEDNLDPW
jgi:hypothetical protein